MPYSTNMITAVADCDLLLAMATKEKATLDFKKLSEQRQKSTYSENAVEIEAELQMVDAEISASQIIINTIPDGEAKDDAAKKLKKQQ